jgi:hypothetical protein
MISAATNIGPVGASADAASARAANTDPNAIRRPAPKRSAQCPATGATIAPASSDADSAPKIHCSGQPKSAAIAGARMLNP